MKRLVSIILPSICVLFIFMVVCIPQLTVSNIELKLYSEEYTEEDIVQLYWDSGTGYNADNKMNSKNKEGEAVIVIPFDVMEQGEAYRLDPVSEAKKVMITRLSVNGQDVPISLLEEMIDATNQCEVQYIISDDGRECLEINVNGNDPYIILNDTYQNTCMEIACGMNHKKVALIAGSIFIMLLLGVLNWVGIKRLKATINFRKFGGWISFGIVFAMATICSIWLNVTEYQFDSGLYWIDCSSIVSNGRIHLLDFPETFRGYFFFLLLGIIKDIGRRMGHEYWAWRVYSNFIFSALVSYIIPKLLGMKIDSIKKAIRVIIAAFFLLIIWGKYLQYPLSDLTAGTFFALGIIMIRLFFEKSESTKMSFSRACLGILGGFFFYSSYNIRAVYLYGGIVVFILVVAFYYKKIGRILALGGMVFMGIALAALPQSLINHQYVGTYSPKVFTEQVNNYEKSLQMQQVFWGLEYEKYETYGGDECDYVGVYYDDGPGTELIRRENLSEESFSFANWLNLVWKYPMDMVALYTRHLIGLIVPAYTDVYIQNMHAAKGMLSLFSILVWIIAGVELRYAYINKKMGRNALWILAIFIPGLLQLFGAAELRFFIMIQFIVFYYVFVFAEGQWRKSCSKEQIISGCLICIIIWALVNAVYSNILSDTRGEIMLINDSATKYESYRENVGNP